MVPHDQVAPHFIYLVLKSKMSFSMPLAPCDAKTCGNGIMCTKSNVSPHFDHCDLIKCNGTIENSIGIPKKLCLDIV